MARQKLSEFKAKELLFSHLGISYAGIQVDSSTKKSFLQKLSDTRQYAVKVDQGVKGRFKKGLVKINVVKKEVSSVLEEFEEKGYSHFLIEEMRPHEESEEGYISFQLTRDGLIVSISSMGGINIESHADSVRTFYLSDQTIEDIVHASGLSKEVIEKITSGMSMLFISFLEINPYIISQKNIEILDLAVEVDSAGEFFVQKKWSNADFVNSSGTKTKEEVVVAELNEKSQASFNLTVLNPDGAIFMLLSGGGASIVLADEVYNRGRGKDLANYGEYSGNPNEEETYLYTKEILSLLKKSHAAKKVLIIAGGVANFTDIRITFKGIRKALDEEKKDLQKEGVKVYVRRGGPHQEEGLRMIEEYLKKENLLGFVSGPEMILTDIVEQALQEINV